MRNGSVAVASMLVLSVTACFSPPDTPLTSESAGQTTGDSTGAESTGIGATTAMPSTGVDSDPDTTAGSNESSSSTSDASTSDASTGDDTTTGSPVDTDGDGVFDDVDNCVAVDNPDQGDLDGDGVGDFCDSEIIDGSGILYVPAGADHSKAGLHCYPGEVRIYGTLHVIPQGGMVGTGTLELRSESAILVAAGGQIDGVGAGFPGGLAAPTNGGMAGAGPRPGCGGGPGSCVANGGSGGGYGGNGGTADPATPYAMGNACTLCSQPTEPHCFGAGGATVGTANGPDLSMGSGGGAGGNSCGCNDSGADGGRGGAMVSLAANDRVRIDGSVTVNGITPATDDSLCGYRPGGGGGSGGGLLVAAELVQGAATGSLSANGGGGGQALGDMNSTWGWAGGGGGGGRIKVFAPTNEYMGGFSAMGGAGGMSPPDGDSYAGIAGQTGTSSATAVIPPAFDNISCN